MANLDLTWFRYPYLETPGNLPAPEVLAREIARDLQAALLEFSAVADAPERATAERGVPG